jgi:hypothetical protein
MKMRITLISDTHGKHRLLDEDLPGGDLLLHAGDFMNGGRDFDRSNLDFLEWFNKIDNYAQTKYSLPVITIVYLKILLIGLKTISQVSYNRLLTR